MEYFDREKAERVWQRVQGEKRKEAVQPSLKSLLLTAGENSAVYAALARQFTGKTAQTMGRFHRETRKAIAAIQGISRHRGMPIWLPKIAVPKEHHRSALEKAYLREKTLWEGFQAGVSDPEHGVVFHALSQQAQNRCAALMALLGRQED